MGNPSRSTKIVSSHKLITGQIMYVFGSHFLTTYFRSIEGNSRYLGRYTQGYKPKVWVYHFEEPGPSRNEERPKDFKKKYSRTKNDCG